MTKKQFFNFIGNELNGDLLNTPEKTIDFCHHYYNKLGFDLTWNENNSVVATAYNNTSPALHNAAIIFDYDVNICETYDVNFSETTTNDNIFILWELHEQAEYYNNLIIKKPTK